MSRIRKLLILFLSVVLFCGCTKKKEMPETVKAVWFAYPDYQEILLDKSEEEYTEIAEEIMADIEESGCNTVYLHVCAFTDAYYPSQIYPMSRDLGNVEYDPFGILLTAAKKHGLRTEAWINPLRSVLEEETADWPEEFILRQWVEENNERIRWVNGRYYLNPAYPEVRKLITSFVQEILDTYEVDGIHFDDYFYPDGAGRNFDAYIYGEENYQNGTAQEVFRTAQINALVQEVHDTVKKKGEDFTFGISVSGNNEYNRDSIYADVYAWMEAGWIDYLAPQIYWGFENPVRPYEPTLEEWQEIIGEHDCDLIVGLAAYKVGAADGYAGTAGQEWVENHDILRRQADTALEHGTKGYALFRYGSLFRPGDDVKEAAEEELRNLMR